MDFYGFHVAQAHSECPNCGTDINPGDNAHRRLRDDQVFCDRCKSHNLIPTGIDDQSPPAFDEERYLAVQRRYRPLMNDLSRLVSDLTTGAASESLINRAIELRDDFREWVLSKGAEEARNLANV